MVHPDSISYKIMDPMYMHTCRGEKGNKNKHPVEENQILCQQSNLVKSKRQLVAQDLDV